MRNKTNFTDFIGREIENARRREQHISNNWTRLFFDFSVQTICYDFVAF